jgi:hypothetical protein
MKKYKIKNWLLYVPLSDLWSSARKMEPKVGDKILYFAHIEQVGNPEIETIVTDELLRTWSESPYQFFYQVLEEDTDV